MKDKEIASRPDAMTVEDKEIASQPEEMTVKHDAMTVELKAIELKPETMTVKHETMTVVHETMTVVIEAMASRYKATNVEIDTGQGKGLPYQGKTAAGHLREVFGASRLSKLSALTWHWLIWVLVRSKNG